MDGNVDPEGIRLDLEWLHRVGVRGVQMFDGGMGTPLVVPERVRHGSPEWRDAVRLAASTAQRLGLEFAVATSAGWSAAGGPWVEPADAMKKVVWSETVVDGGRPVEQRLPPLPDVAGPYQDCPRWGADPAAHRFVRDWVVVAVPADDVPGRAAPCCGRGVRPARRLVVPGRRQLRRRPSRCRGIPTAPSIAWLEQVFDEPVDRRRGDRRAARARGASAPRRRRTPCSRRATTAATYRVVAELPEVASRRPRPCPCARSPSRRSRARRFRLVLTGTERRDGAAPSRRRRAAAAGPAAGVGVPRLGVRALGRAAGSTTPSSRPASPRRRTTTPSTPTRPRDRRRSTRPGWST